MGTARLVCCTVACRPFGFNKWKSVSAMLLGLGRLNINHIPGEPKKIPPLRLLLILQQCMGIFVRNFTRLLSDQIYTLSPNFIEIFLELTKLHSFNHDNPHFTVFVSMFIRMSIQCSLKFEITSITKERLLASTLTSLLTSVATHLADDFFLKCSF